MQIIKGHILVPVPGVHALGCENCHEQFSGPVLGLFKSGNHWDALIPPCKKAEKGGEMPANSYVKLHDGTWGVRVIGKQPAPGATVEVQTKAGQIKNEKIKEVIWSGAVNWTLATVHLCSINGPKKPWQSKIVGGGVVFEYKKGPKPLELNDLQKAYVKALNQTSFVATPAKTAAIKKAVGLSECACDASCGCCEAPAKCDPECVCRGGKAYICG